MVEGPPISLAELFIVNHDWMAGSLICATERFNRLMHLNHPSDSDEVIKERIDRAMRERETCTALGFKLFEYYRLVAKMQAAAIEEIYQ